MKEFGVKGAPHAQLLCTDPNCDLNVQDPIPLVTPDMALEEAAKHDQIPGHEGVVVYRGNDRYALTSQVGMQVLAATAVILY